MYMKKLNIIGEKFNRLTVVSECVKRTKSGKVQFECICDCGNKIKAVGSHVKNGHTKSCSCLQKEKTKKSQQNIIHGLSKSPIYKIYYSMISRCYNNNSEAYKDYGGRGIKVCDRWKDSFINFYKDIGERPSKKYSLDRIDNNGDYKPSNCKWSTIIEQENNKRTNVYLLYKGSSYTVAILSRMLNIPYYTLWRRTINKGIFTYE